MTATTDRAASMKSLEPHQQITYTNVLLSAPHRAHLTFDTQNMAGINITPQAVLPGLEIFGYETIRLQGIELFVEAINNRHQYAIRTLSENMWLKSRGYLLYTISMGDEATIQ
ncbi:uncharacterized protein DFL_006450 [Arthrobotrys flagrans]|uniref:Uncharacterized protein n=1 Tax=Arthrobotrys flagrans TaxID=97331 RepID=A0A437A129_ARTFL|nr:hypothetical protein DFL_006450 [Arthrobotrys flagrans]